MLLDLVTAANTTEAVFSVINEAMKSS